MQLLRKQVLNYPLWQQRPDICLNVNALLKPNISREEAWALTDLKQDKSRFLLTAYKGMAMVMLDEQDYNN